MLLKLNILIAEPSYGFLNTFSTSNITETDIQQPILHFYVGCRVFRLVLFGYSLA